MTPEHFDHDHIHTTPEGRHFRHGDGIEVDGEGNQLEPQTVYIDDGVYFLSPEGSAWIAARFRDGICVATAHECDYSSHNAANDDWADIAPSDEDTTVSAHLATEIVRRVMGEDVHPEMVLVTKSV